MLMVGMLMDAGRPRRRAPYWRLRGVAVRHTVAAAAWFLLPFDAAIRQAAALCCLAPIAVFSTMFTDKVLGNARLAVFARVDRRCR